ncbi:MAG TPA: FAD-dependent oxidoreductase [Abditibacteriaceae bacterium]|jgi:hypothetical protein
MRTSTSRFLPFVPVSPKNTSRLVAALAALACAGVAIWLFAVRNVRYDKTPSAPSYDTNSAHGASFTSFAGQVANCDVLVTGGTPAGVAAALAAARRGANVVLVEPREKMGGDIVYAMLNMFDVPVRPGEASPVHGIFAEFYDQLGLSCDIDKAERLFGAALAAEPSLRVYNRTRALSVLKEGDAVVGAVLRSAEGKDYELRARVVIDATNDASFAARAGAGYYLGRENANRDKRMQSAGLLFSVSGVDWNKVRFYVRGKRPMRAGEKSGEKVVAPKARPVGNDRTSKPATKPQVWLRLGGVHGNYAWERGDIVKRYKPRGGNIIPLSINFGRQSDGTVVLNTINIVGVNGLDPVSAQRAHREASAELPRFINYLRRAMPGFEKARLAQIAPELYIRETRHIHGYYSLKVSDIRAETRFFDRIAFASYPLDLHPYVKGQLNPFGARRYYYTLPLRSLVPRGVNNVFVASRSLSATYSAAGSARVIPITMAAGEAAGAAAWVCVRDSVTPHALMDNSKLVRKLQDSLRAWGCDIGDVYPTPQQRTKEKEDRPTA